MATEADLALALYHKLMASPTLRPKALALFKELNPDAVVPELDLQKPVMDEVAKLRDELTKLREERANERTDNGLRGTFDALKRDRSYTDEGISAIQKLMLDKSIADPTAAADHFDRLNAKPAMVDSVMWSGQSAGFNTSQDDFKAWVENPSGEFDKAVNAVLSESRSVR